MSELKNKYGLVLNNYWIKIELKLFDISLLSFRGYGHHNGTKRAK